jgi:hypothetical protein
MSAIIVNYNLVIKDGQILAQLVPLVILMVTGIVKLCQYKDHLWVLL